MKRLFQPTSVLNVNWHKMNTFHSDEWSNSWATKSFSLRSSINNCDFVGFYALFFVQFAQEIWKSHSPMNCRRAWINNHAQFFINAFLKHWTPWTKPVFLLQSHDSVREDCNFDSSSSTCNKFKHIGWNVFVCILLCLTRSTISISIGLCSVVSLFS